MAEIQFENRMSDSDALMWNIEKDPLLRSTITIVWLLDRSPDRGRLEDKIERATRQIPRLRERVVSNPLSIAPPRWEVDPYFDLNYHVRWLRSPGEGRLRDLLDLAQPLAMQGFDRARPLWELSIVEGLEEGRAGFLMKLHHAVSDGVGLVHMTNRLVEREREPSGPPKPMPPAPEASLMTQPERVRDALRHEWRRQLGRARRAGEFARRAAGQIAGRPISAAQSVGDTAASVARMLRPVNEPLSPIMRGRSLSVRFDGMAVPLADLKAAAKAVDGTLNDAFVAAVTGGLRRYHDEHGVSLDELRMTMPINTRSGEKGRTAGNQFVPARFSVPINNPDPARRMKEIGALVGTQRREPALGYIDDLATVLNRLPTSISTALFGSMLKGIDFVTSNVPGPRFAVYTGGARMESVYGFGPLSGAAANVTLFSYRGHVQIGINTDPAAVPDPDVFVQCLHKGFDEVLSTK